MEFLVFALVSFVAADHDGVFISKTTDRCIVPNRLRMLVSMPEQLAG